MPDERSGMNAHAPNCGLLHDSVCTCNAEVEIIRAALRMVPDDDVRGRAFEALGFILHTPSSTIGSARFLLRAADRLAAAVAQRIDRGHLDARSEAGDALLDYDTLVDHRAALGVGPREGRIGV